MKFILTNFGPTYPLGIGGGALSNIDLLKVLKKLGYDVVNIGFFEQENLSRYKDIFSQAKQLDIVKGTIDHYLYLWNKEILCINKSWRDYLKTLVDFSSNKKAFLILRPYGFRSDDNMGLWEGRMLFWNNDFDINRAKAGIEIVKKQKGKVVAISKMLSRLMKEKYGVDSDVIRSAIDFQNLRMKPKESLKLKGKKPIIGLPNPNKFKFGSLPLLITEKLFEYQFLVVTSWGWDDVSLSQLRKKVNVKILRYLINMNEFYKKIDILLVPTILPESYPRFIQEALYLRIPIVASAIGELPELIGPSGIVANPHNIDSWEYGINNAIKIPFSKLEEGRKRVIKFQNSAVKRMRKYFLNISTK